ncbi:MAG TPA: SsrA-binding protein SmpB [Alphaproteobacteria bacterium]|nr:SsrA-binding protein SmpB [Alphaproteobacteria bacterium]
MPKSRKDAQKYAALNRRARHDYEVEETIEAGLMLTGSEVKALRAGQVSITEAYAGIKEGALYLMNATFAKHAQSGAHLQHEPLRARKLLVHKRQQNKLIGAVKREGATLVPLSIYFNARGIAKLQLALAKGRTKVDKRAAIKAREWEREKAKVLRNKR